MKTFVLSQRQKGTTKRQWVEMRDATQPAMDGKFLHSHYFFYYVMLDLQQITFKVVKTNRKWHSLTEFIFPHNLIFPKHIPQRSDQCATAPALGT